MYIPDTLYVCKNCGEDATEQCYYYHKDKVIAYNLSEKLKTLHKEIQQQQVALRQLGKILEKLELDYELERQQILTAQGVNVYMLWSARNKKK